MRKIKNFLVTILAVFTLTVCNGQEKFKNIMEDFNSLVGSWQGSLTYLDYTSAKPYTMPANLEVSRIGQTNKFIFSNIYPNEQGANTVDTIDISTDGKFINKEPVKTRKVLANGDIEIVTEEKGSDGNENKQATLKYTYILGKNHYSKRKDVQFEGETRWIKRHEYSYIRKTSK